MKQPSARNNEKAGKENIQGGQEDSILSLDAWIEINTKNNEENALEYGSLSNFHTTFLDNHITFWSDLVLFESFYRFDHISFIFGFSVRF